MKQPWTDDLNEFLKIFNPKSKSYKDVVKAVEVAWQASFSKYSNMLILKDETISPEQEILKLVENFDWERDFNRWFWVKQYPDEVMGSLKECWEEAFNNYVKMGQTQAELNSRGME